MSLLHNILIIVLLRFLNLMYAKCKKRIVNTKNIFTMLYHIYNFFFWLF